MARLHLTIYYYCNYVDRFLIRSCTIKQSGPVLYIDSNAQHEVSWLLPWVKVHGELDERSNRRPFQEGGSHQQSIPLPLHTHTHTTGQRENVSAQKRFVFSCCQIPTAREIDQVVKVNLEKEGETNLLVDRHREQPRDGPHAPEHGQHPADVADDVQVSAQRR
jgi:hypothetical protein